MSKRSILEAQGKNGNSNGVVAQRTIQVVVLDEGVGDIVVIPHWHKGGGVLFGTVQRKSTMRSGQGGA